VCPDDSSHADAQSNKPSKSIQDLLNSVGILQKIEPPKHVEYATIEARLKSFEKCLKKIKQDIYTLCEAGFFYIGSIFIF